MISIRSLLPLAICALAPLTALAQWEPDVRLTNDPLDSITCFNNAKCVAAEGAVIHVVWHDNRDGNSEIYYKRSIDNGTTWGPDTRITDDSSWSERPSIAVRNSVVHVAWYDGRLGPPRIFYKRSLDNGTTWGADLSLTPTAGVAYHPSIAVSDAVVHIAWTDMSAGPQIYYTRSTDNGTIWETARNITPGSPPAGKNLASIAVADSRVHVTWMDYRSDAQIYYTRSLDYGVTWETDRSITPVPAQFASVAVSDCIVHVVYADFRFGSDTPKIYYTRSLNDGTDWEPEIPLAEAFCSWYPSVAVAGSDVHAVWLDDRHGDVAEVYYKRSMDAGANWEPDVRLTDDPSQSSEPSVAVAGTHVHVAWHDDRDGNWEIYYKRGETGGCGVEEEEGTFVSAPRALVVPSIFSGPVSVRLDGALRGPLKVGLYDVLGAPVWSETLGALPASMNVGGPRSARLAPGVYFLRIEADRQTEAHKLIKVR